jgi:predicted dehydrogenase
VLDATGTRQYSVPGFLERFLDAYQMELQQFVLDVLGEKDAPAVTVTDGVRVLEVALAANESMRLNKPITIDQWKSEV